METVEKRSTGKKRGKLLSGLLKSALLAAGFFTYLLAGAMVFQMLEQESESNVKEETERHRLDFLKNYTCLTHDAMEHLIKAMGQLPPEHQVDRCSVWPMHYLESPSISFFSVTLVKISPFGVNDLESVW